MAKREIAVKDCDRCGGQKKPAAVTRKWGLDKDQYEIDLCGEHAMAFDRDLGAWARLSRDITPEIYKSIFDITRNRQLDRAARSAFRPTPSRDPKVITVQKLPAKFHTWTLSKHAQERCAERGISQHDVLLAAADPALAYRDQKTGEWIHQRGPLYCYVARDTNTVITIVTEEMRAETARQAKEAAHASD